jgi:uncharacterized protein (TIGR03067 family)
MRMTVAAWSVLAVVAGSTWVIAQDKHPDVERMQGRWEVVELVEDGKVIPPEAIKEWLPSGGKLEIVDNAIIFQSPADGKRHVKLFSVDATQSPKGLDIVTKEGKDASGIVRFEEKQVVLCLADGDASRPTEFSAKEGSKRLLMTLARPESAAPTKSPTAVPTRTSPGIAAKPLTDPEVQGLLKGSWRYLDDAGALYVTFSDEGRFSTVREVKELRLFQKAFVQTPVSSGTWTMKDGQLNLRITASVHPDRVNHTFPFSIRSISQKDFIFVDYLGRVGQATRVR